MFLPSRSFWRTALANARLLRAARFHDVYVWKNMTAEERKREYDLRQQAREPNRGKPKPEWIVYRSELVHSSKLPRSLFHAFFYQKKNLMEYSLQKRG